MNPVTDLSKFNLCVEKIDNNIDRCAYTLTKNCSSCHSVIGKTGLKKFYCHFCYKAFCLACLDKSAIHPESRDPEKMCNECFIYYAKLQVVKNSTGHVVLCLHNDIKLRENAIRHTEELRTKLENLKSEKIELEKKNLLKFEKKNKYLQELVKNFEEYDEEVEKSADAMAKIFDQIALESTKSELEKILQRVKY